MADRPSKIVYRSLLTLAAFFLLLWGRSLHADPSSPQRRYFKEGLQTLLGTEAKDMDLDDWADAYGRCADPSLDPRPYLIKQTDVIRRVRSFYRPEMVPLLSTLMTIAETLGQKHRAWVAGGGKPVFSKKAQAWIERGIFDDLASKRLEISVIDEISHFMAASSHTGRKSVLSLPKSVAFDPTGIDCGQFERIAFHEYFHLLNEHGVPKVMDEVEAELFTWKALALLHGGETARTLYRNSMHFPEQDAFRDSVRGALETPAVMKRIADRIDGKIPEGFGEFPARMAALAESEMRTGEEDAAVRRERAGDFAMVHLINMGFAYGISAGKFNAAVNDRIRHGDLPADYAERYASLLSSEEVLHLTALQSNEAVSATTLKFHIALFRSALLLYAARDKGAKDLDDRAERFVSFLMHPEVLKGLEREILQPLLIPLDFHILSPADMKRILSGSPLWRSPLEEDRPFDLFQE